MQATKETARAARMQCGQFIEMLAKNAPETLEVARPLIRDVINFCDAAGRLLPSAESPAAAESPASAESPTGLPCRGEVA